MSRRALGEATDALEARVEAAITALGLSGGGVSYSRVAAGITNHNWLISDGDRTIFLKLFGEGTDQFIDRATSSEASRIAGELDVGPELIAYLPDQGAEAFAYLDGYRTVSSEEMMRPDVRLSLLAAYRRMHGAGRIGLTRTGFDQLDERVRLAVAGGAPLPPDLDHLLWQCNRARDVISEAGIDLGICHNDSYAANFMIADSGDVRIIDWEYAANNDPAWDLGMLAMGRPGSAGAATIVRDYLGEDRPALAARVLLYGGVVFVSWGLWAALQARISTIPFDFRTYSKTLFEFGRLKLRDPAWEAALWQV